jgi:hypothetical protein
MTRIALMERLLPILPLPLLQWRLARAIARQDSLLPFLRLALQHQRPDLLMTLLRSPTPPDFHALCVETAATPTHHPALASALMAMAADFAIAQENWTSYTQGLTAWAGRRNGGIYAWAHLLGLPVLDCLPLKEALASRYGLIPDEGTFRLGYALANHRSGHQHFTLTRLLEHAGTDPVEALYRPTQPFLDGCLALPALPLRKKRR